MRKYSYLLSLFVALALTIVFAESSRAADPNDFRKPNQWQRERTINDAINKSSVKVEAQKTYPVSTLDQNGKPIKQIRNAKATIKLGASTANVGKSLLKRAPQIAITNAVIAILGKSVDWVLDPENNRIRYTPDAPTIPDDGSWGATCSFTVTYGGHTATGFKSPHQACSSLVGVKYSNYTFIMGSHIQSDMCAYAVLFDSGKEAHFPEGASMLSSKGECSKPSTPEPQEEYIPISNLAAKVINQADAGDAAAMQVMNDAALDALEAGLLDAQLDAASNVPQPDPQEITQAQYDNPDYPENGTGSGTGPETPVDPETPTDPDAKPFELPPFCSWASKVCDFIDWVKTEPPEPPESGEVDVQIPDSNMHEGILERLYINMPAQCPPDPILEFMGAKIPFPMSVFCQFAEMMKPLILLFAYIKGLSIIGNGLT